MLTSTPRLVHGCAGYSKRVFDSSEVLPASVYCNNPGVPEITARNFLPENEPINRYSLFCLKGHPNVVTKRIHVEINDIKGETLLVDLDMPEPALAAFEKELWIPVEEP